MISPDDLLRAREFLNEGERIRIGDIDRQGNEQMPERSEVEPYLTALFQAEHLNLLLGSGLTIGAGALVGDGPGGQMNATLSIDDPTLSALIENEVVRSALASTRGTPNLEDRLRVAMSTHQGLKNLADPRTEILGTAIQNALQDLSHSVTEAEAAIAAGESKRVAGSITLASLLTTFFASFGSRSPTRDRLHVFTTNYDRLIEWSAELAGLRIIDRFVGSLRPIFRSSRLEVDLHYSPPGSIHDPRHLDGVFRLTKLHGSLDWEWDASNRRVVRTPLPFGRPRIPTNDDVLIYPNSAKDLETTYYPYAELFRDCSAALCRPNSALITYGYGFGDEHVNRIIRDMLTIPSTHVLIISYDDPGGRLSQFADSYGRLGQVSLILGPQIAEITQLIDRWLPWPSAEFLLRRRAQIQRDRSNMIPVQAEAISDSVPDSGTMSANPGGAVNPKDADAK